MRQFPLFFNTDGAKAVVFGGGEEARRKVRLLAKTQAGIVIIAKHCSPALLEEFGARVRVAAPAEAAAELDGAAFVIVALEDDGEAERAVALAKARGLPVNAVDRPELCDFTVPSLLARGDLVAAVGSAGSAPVLAKRVREQLEAAMPARLGELAAAARALRPAVKAALPEGRDRRRFWEAALSGPAANAILAGEADGEARLRAELDAFARGAAPRGVVHIVGAGPGDPELLTVKALRLIQSCDVVYYDKLVSPEILDLVRRDADRVPVGKSKGDHLVPQPRIHELLTAAAAEGKRVVRLKGGDPFVFGRGGEELAALQAAGVDVQVVPGISAALGCAASAGLPLTHRDHAQSVVLVTGHARAGGVPDLDWPALARANQTVVVFMGVGTAPRIASELIGAGRAPSTPVAVIENGTRPDEIRAFGQLSGLGALIDRHGIKGPALLVIGDVAALPAEALSALLQEAAA